MQVLLHTQLHHNTQTLCPLLDVYLSLSTLIHTILRDATAVSMVHFWCIACGYCKAGSCMQLGVAQHSLHLLSSLTTVRLAGCACTTVSLFSVALRPQCITHSSLIAAFEQHQHSHIFADNRRSALCSALWHSFLQAVTASLSIHSAQRATLQSAKC